LGTQKTDSISGGINVQLHKNLEFLHKIQTHSVLQQWLGLPLEPRQETEDHELEAQMIPRYITKLVERSVTLGSDSLKEMSSFGEYSLRD